MSDSGASVEQKTSQDGKWDFLQETTITCPDTIKKATCMLFEDVIKGFPSTSI